jgi:hypothetical protein
MFYMRRSGSRETKFFLRNRRFGSLGAPIGIPPEGQIPLSEVGYSSIDFL